MAEDRKGLKIKEDGLGEVQIAEEVITIIAGLAATEGRGCMLYGRKYHKRAGKPSWNEEPVQRCPCGSNRGRQD